MKQLDLVFTCVQPILISVRCEQKIRFFFCQCKQPKTEYPVVISMNCMRLNIQSFGGENSNNNNDNNSNNNDILNVLFKKKQCQKILLCYSVQITNGKCNWLSVNFESCLQQLQFSTLEKSAFS